MIRALAHCALILALVTLAVPAAARAQESTFQGKTVVVKADDGAIVVWDATPEIITIVHSKLSDAAANEKLKRDGLKALANELGSLDKKNPNVTLRIIYAKTGDVNPAYKAVTFTGVEHYATIVMQGPEAFGNKDKWLALKADKPVPEWVQYKVTGALPPR